MARTRAEVRAFLDSKVNHICVDQSDQRLNGQCVCLIKNLMDFLGVPNPYAARGNAKDAGDAYIRQGIGTSGRGWLTVVVNRDMGLIAGVRYGHIWLDLLNESNFESNGARALYVTKNTRPVQQGQQFINFDKWITGDDEMPIQDTDHEYSRWRDLGWRTRGRELSRGEFRASAVGFTWLKAIEILCDDSEANMAQGWQDTGRVAVIDNWRGQIAGLSEALGKRPTPEQLAQAQADATKLAGQLDAAAKRAQDAELKAAAATKAAADAQIEAERLKAQADADTQAGLTFWRRVGQALSKLLPGGK